MLSKNEIKYIQSLGQKKQRDEARLFIAEGPKLAKEVLKSDFEIIHIYALADWANINLSNGYKVTIITEDELQRISNLQTANQLLIIAGQKQPVNEPLIKDNITLVLDGIQDPGNMGTLIRIADWFGIKQVVCSDDSVEVYNPKVVQATMGSICRANVWYKNLNVFLGEASTNVYGALLEGENVYDAEKISEGLLVLGNESKGISKNVISKITNPVTIPRIGSAESLNVAVAAGILISHLIKFK